MSDNNYGRQTTPRGGPYGQYNPYAQPQNEQYGSAGGYGQRSGYGQQAGAYGSRQTGSNTHSEPQTYPSVYSPEDRNNQAYEMNAMNGQTSERNDPNPILRECRDVDYAIEEVDRKVNELRTMYRETPSIVTTEEDRRHKAKIEATEVDTMALYRNLAQRVKNIKLKPESENEVNKLQVGKVDRHLRTAIQNYQSAGAEYRGIVQDQIKRQYLTINRDATQDELTEVANDPSNRVFSQALLQNNRRGQAQSTLQQVSNRHMAIKQIEKDAIELAQLVQDMDATVIQHEPQIQNIEQGVEEVKADVSKGEADLEGALVNKRKANRRRCWFFGILLLIIIIIVVVVVVVVLVLRSRNNPSSPAPAPRPTTSAVRRTRFVRERDMDHA